MEDHQRQIGQRVVKLREARDWGQPELSKASGISIKTISRIENGHVEGRRDTLRAIAKALEVSRGELEGTPPAPLGLGAPEDVPLATQDDIDRLEDKLDRLLSHFGVDVNHHEEENARRLESERLDPGEPAPTDEEQHAAADDDDEKDIDAPVG